MKSSPLLVAALAACSSSATTQSLLGVFSVGDDVYAVGGFGTIVHRK